MILIVDDDRAIRVTLTLLLERNEYAVMSAEGPAAAMDVVRSHSDLELVLMDMNYTLATDGEEGLTLLKQVKVFRPDTPVILMTAWGTIDLAVQGMRNGAFDFITKPWSNAVLMDRIETAILLNKPIAQSSNNGHQVASLNGFRSCGLTAQPPTAQPQPHFEVVGQSSALLSVLATAQRVAQTNAPVLITGESGTGKELIAQFVHEQSRRMGKPFVKVNLGGISSSLFESEMFGHKKGSFTDAKSDRAGRFELAEGGTIFLDEIGELELPCQVKLLRVLQDQTYEVLGDSVTRRANVRMVCATNADLRQMVQEKTFREDLFYRINLIHLHLPPLRERQQDIPLLVDHFIRQTCAANALPPVSASEESIRYLQTLPFHGNIRELKNLVERTILMKDQSTPSGQLTVEDFKASHQQETSMPPIAPSPAAGVSAGMTLEEIERTSIAAAIEKHSGNLSLVAKELGISRGALYRKIEKHGL
ncbi:MAG: sigma-54-dependent Fis family transcriptional regulator [Bacteroidaceae bacterium]|nr:sigma-54-dependent Fis family transcriptional regulator [Bacteroidaceae bacterium]